MNGDYSPDFSNDDGVSSQTEGSPVTEDRMPERDLTESRGQSLWPHSTTHVDLPSGRLDEELDLARDTDNSNLLKSFDMIFQLHQRSEEIRARLEKIDRILLSSRTVADLTRLVTETIETEFALTATRILYRQGHPAALLLGWDPPLGAGVLPDEFFENERLFQSESFVLDNPSGPLARSLFGVDAPLISSAAVATLCVGNEELGILCLGSDDPMRYCGGMNTELIASLAHKISLGIQNAWDHEKRGQEALTGVIDGIFSNVFFRELAQWEFDRAWRYGKIFSLMAISWNCHAAEDFHPAREVLGLIKTNIRACDLAAYDDADTVWVLLPETDAAGARAVAERLAGMAMESFFGEITFHVGITEFSRSAPVVSRLVNKARLALEEAMESVNSRIVVKTPTLPDAFSETSPPSSSLLA